MPGCGPRAACCEGPTQDTQAQGAAQGSSIVLTLGAKGTGTVPSLHTGQRPEPTQQLITTPHEHPTPRQAPRGWVGLYLAPAQSNP